MPPTPRIREIISKFERYCADGVITPSERRDLLRDLEECDLAEMEAVNWIRYKRLTPFRLRKRKEWARDWERLEVGG